MNRLPGGMRLPAASSVRNPLFTLRVAKNDLPYNRFAFVITKKIDKRAVVRNKIKRKMTACIEKLNEKLEKGHDMLFFAKTDITSNMQNEVCTTIQKVLKKEGVLK